MREQHLIETLAFRQDWNKIRKSLKAVVSLDYIDDAVYLDLIGTNKETRGLGHASDAMRQLIALCDKHQLALLLSPEALGQGNDGALDQSKLEAWYTRLGFVPIEQDDWTWIRHPQ